MEQAARWLAAGAAIAIVVMLVAIDRREASAPQASGRPAAGLRRAPFESCDEAWAAGSTPIRRGQPGYSPQLDADGNGLACEPYIGRGLERLLRRLLR